MGCGRQPTPSRFVLFVATKHVCMGLHQMIGLVDGNNFYVSCERIFDLSLEGRPVAVLSNNDGCVISRSPEFKALGIPMGTPFFQLRPLQAIHGLILKSSNYELYGDISRRVIATLQEFSPDVEQYSIDEAFIHLELPAGSDYAARALEIRRTVLNWVGIPCGVGFATSRTLAKIANHIAKKRPDGIFVMPQDASGILAELPVSEVWGVGNRTATKLNKLGIFTAWQLAVADQGELRKKFNVCLARTALELNGKSVISPEDPEQLSQSISCSRSFGHPVTDFDELVEAVAFYTARAAEKLRSEKQLAAGVNVYFQYFPESGSRQIAGGFAAATVIFPEPVAHTAEILKCIHPRLPGLFCSGRRYKKAGIVFFGLEPAFSQQPDLFAESPLRQKEKSLSSAVDQLNRTLGRGTIFNLAEGIARPWAMKREHLSPNFTTSWEQLPKAF